MISKELLGTVLKIPLHNIRYNNTTNLYETFKDNLFNWGSGDYGRWSNLEINIYELAHKCKEWAKNKNSDNGGPVGGYTLFSKSGDKWNKAVCYCDEIRLSIPTQQANSEPEAIFKACQWILDNKDNK